MRVTDIHADAVTAEALRPTGRAGVGPLDLAVPAGARIAIVGGNGTGKSALLRTLALLAPPAGGRLALFGHEVADLAASERTRLRRSIGAAFADDRFIEKASAADNLALPLRVHGEDEAPIAEVVGEFLVWLGLGAYDATPVAALSLGERRLLAIGRAAIARPDLLLLDEPLEALDEAAIRRTAQLTAELSGLGCAVLVTTTRAETARRLDCVPLALVEGRLREDGARLRVAS